jgi:WhiB family transcriptional regulator, redox-sensing transcriptional regulator
MSVLAVTLATAGHDWRNQAACRSAGPALFFPVGTTPEIVAQIGQAKDICRHCPVRGDCL